MAKRKKYSEEFTREVVNFIRKPYANISQIARDIGVPEPLSLAMAPEGG